MLTLLRLPAALLLGAIAGAALVSSHEGEVRVPPRFFLLAQAIIGGMVAKFIRPDILHEIARDWPLFVAAAVSVIVVSCLLGWALARFRIFADSTPIWGSLPGAASAMVLLADAYGADMRLVAFMQYLRVLLVALVASLIARFFTPGVADGPGPWLAAAPPLDWPAFALTCALLVSCAWLGQRLRIPAGPMLLPLIVGASLQDFGLMTLELPRAIARRLLWRARLEHRPALHRRHPAPRLQGAAGGAGVDPDPDRALRRLRRAAGAFRPCGRHDRLSRHQPRRHGRDRHHRRLDEDRHALRDVAANRADFAGDPDRPGAGAAGGATPCGRRRGEQVNPHSAGRRARVLMRAALPCLKSAVQARFPQGPPLEMKMTRLRLAAVLLASALSLPALSLPALAQTAAPKPAAPNSAAPNSAPMPAVPSEPQNTSATYGDWMLRCQRVGEGAGARKICEVAETIQAGEKRQPVAEVALSRLNKADPLRLTATGWRFLAT